MSAKKAAQKPAKRATATRQASGVFTAEERALMKARAQQVKAEERAKESREAGEREAIAAIAAMEEPDRGMAKRIHAIIQKSAPDLWPRTWYGMPSYAKEGKVLCFFRERAKFKERYAMLGFQDNANLDDGAMWPVAFALPKLTAADEKKIAALVEKAVR
jgi:uncharacterized protein YdhG (YjbR/CyaY superfamily)